MLKLAIAAQLPLVSVTTRDTLNLSAVLVELTNKTPIAFQSNMPFEKNQLYLYVYPGVPTGELSYGKLYEKMVVTESTLVVVNAPRVDDLFFQAGEVPVPRRLLLQFMNEVVDDKPKAEALLQGLGGCTIKESAELARLTMARDNSLLLPGIMETRKSSFQGSSGLTQVETRQGFYRAPDMLQKWVETEKKFFLKNDDPRLMPRGLLFDGVPGVGKTAGAKWLAEQIGVPLFRVDIGGTKNKYIGQSEQNMLTNLARLDQEEPAVALLDEVEKVFATSTTDLSGTTSTMLSQLLWWLAERKSRVLVVMTTNNAAALPKELYREGRIDQTMLFKGLSEIEAPEFVADVLKTFSGQNDITIQKLKTQILKECFPSGVGAKPLVSQALLTKVVYSYVKLQQIPSKA